MPEKDKKIIPFEAPPLSKEKLPERARFMAGTPQRDLGEVFFVEVGDFLHIVQGDQSVRLCLNDLFKNEGKIQAFKGRHRQ